MIKRMARGCMFMSMAPSTKANGLKTNKTAMVSRRGPMEHATKEPIYTAKNTEQAHSGGQITACTSENSTTTTSTERVFICGATAASTRVTGRPTKCTEGDPSRGVIAANMLENTSKTRKMGTESLYGQMDVNTKETGLMANSTGKGCT